jgi:hypothetical protein
MKKELAHRIKPGSRNGYEYWKPSEYGLMYECCTFTFTKKVGKIVGKNVVKQKYLPLKNDFAEYKSERYYRECKQKRAVVSLNKLIRAFFHGRSIHHFYFVGRGQPKPG